MICSQTMAVMIMNDPAKKVEVTLCPPAEQEVFFQEQQFDEDLGRGTDPRAYVNGSLMIFGAPDPANPNGPSVKRKRLKAAEKALEGHENKEAILRILRTE